MSDETKNAVEMTDLYTKDRIRVGSPQPRSAKTPDGLCRLITHLCIFDSAGRMLIQKRQPWKKRLPGLWDVSVSGAVVSGEGSREAAVREAREELGLSFAPDELTFALSVYGRGRIDDLYTVTRDVDTGALTLLYDEVAAAKTASKEEIFQMVSDGVFVPFRRELLEMIFVMKDGSGVLSE